MASDPALEQALEGHRGSVNGLQFGTDSMRMVSGGEDGVVFLWNFRPGARAFRYTGHKVRACLCPWVSEEDPNAVLTATRMPNIADFSPAGTCY
jgi:WD40 repeat protein